VENVLIFILATLLVCGDLSIFCYLSNVELLFNAKDNLAFYGS